MTGRLPLTTVEQRLYAILRAAAEDGMVCPTNEALVARMGLKTESGVSQIIRQIEAKEWIEVERRSRWRRIVIVDTGRAIESRLSNSPANIERRERRERHLKAAQAKMAIGVHDCPVEALRASMAHEAMAFQQRRAAASMMSNTAIAEIEHPRSPQSTFTMAGGEPCFQCGVKRADHDAHGCKRWRARP